MIIYCHFVLYLIKYGIFMLQIVITKNGKQKPSPAAFCCAERRDRKETIWRSWLQRETQNQIGLL